MTMEFDTDITELASVHAGLGDDDDIDDDAEMVLDILYAEHEAMMYAANSYDLDATAYGEMV